MLFGTRCGACGRPGHSPCARCIKGLVSLGEVELAGVDRCLALVDYDDLSSRLIGSLKYRGVRTSVRWFATALAQLVAWSDEPTDLVTWVPAAGLNLRRRGFDQSHEVARRVAEHLGLPARRQLERERGQSQTGRSRVERLQGPNLAASATCPPTVLVVDDVLTTGASMQMAAAALRRAGATRVIAAVLAHRQLHDGGVARRGREMVARPCL